MKDVCAGSKEYLVQKKRNLANFKKFLDNVEGVKDPLENVVNQPEKLENYVKNYFFQRGLHEPGLPLSKGIAII